MQKITTSNVILISMIIFLTGCNDNALKIANDRSTRVQAGHNYHVPLDGGGIVGRHIFAADLGDCFSINNPDSSFYGTSICVPPGALDEDTEISIYDPLADASDNGVVPSDQSLFAAGVPVRFEPGGLKFNIPATIWLPFDTTITQDAWTPPEGLRVFAHEHPGDPSYEVAQVGVDTAVGLVSAEISSFTTFQPQISFPVFQTQSAAIWRAKVRVNAGIAAAQCAATQSATFWAAPGTPSNTAVPWAL